MFSLSPAQILQLEGIRNGSDLELTLWISGECIFKNRSGVFSGQTNFTIQQQDWLSVLAEMHYKETLLFELPLPKGISDLCRGYIDQARESLLRGDSRGCVGSCREVLDVFAAEMGEAHLLRLAKNVKPTDRSLEQRMLMIRDSVRQVTNLGHHVSEDSFSQLHASQILGMTVALLSQQSGREIK